MDNVPEKISKSDVEPDAQHTQREKGNLLEAQEKRESESIARLSRQGERVVVAIAGFMYRVQAQTS